MNEIKTPSASTRESLWEAFLAKWPLEKLSSMNLESYTSQGEIDSFCHWLESRTEELGSIWGGSAFKFGVYARKDKTPKEGSGGRLYNDDYGWMGKYGDTPQEAFLKVRDEIVRVANAALHGQLGEVDKADLGAAIRWKIAFLYQDRAQRVLLPIYTPAMLKVLVEQPSLPTAQLHEQLLSQRGEQSFFDYANNLWTEARERLDKLTVEQAQAFFDDSSDYELIKPPTQYMAGYQTLDGKQIGLVRQNKDVTLFFRAGPWIESIRQHVASLTEYKSNEGRHSGLKANAPQLWLGEAMVSLVVHSLASLEQVCMAYDETNEKSSSVIEKNKEITVSEPLNQILYGPPGTGKTYATVDLAVRVAEPERYKETLEKTEESDQRQVVKQLYDELVAEGRIAFTTFHQSFAYEDFIEGIRANANNDKESESLTYQIEDGVFKSLADQAAKVVSGERPYGLSSSPTIWKISIGQKHQKAMRDRYIQAGEARIGWNETGDVTFEFEDRTPEQQTYWESLTQRNHTAINNFANDIQPGDVLLCLKDVHTIQAVGVVTSDYYYDESVLSTPSEYAHVRKVDWLLTDIELNILPLNNNHRIVQQTVYPLNRITWNSLKAELNNQDIALPTHAPISDLSPDKAPNYVLIIDEINRGNISRIFGELITLLEPDKRKGGLDERTVILPYSKEPFSVPENLFVIGTMNTADKSLTQLDLALRRRFEFVEVMPNADLLSDITVHGINISSLLRVMNDRIEVLLDRDHLIGHSYFFPLCRNGVNKESLLATIFAKRIIPLLQEYFFSDWEKIAWVLNDIDKDSHEQFIQLSSASNSLRGLFSNKIAEEVQDRRYRINEAAFHTPVSYQKIFLAAESA